MGIDNSKSIADTIVSQRALLRVTNASLLSSYLPMINQERWDHGFRRETITVRGQSYFSRLPKYCPPPPSPSRPGECVPPAFVAGGGQTRRAERGMGGGSIFWKTREIGLPSYSKICTLCAHGAYRKEGRGVGTLWVSLKQGLHKTLSPTGLIDARLCRWFRFAQLAKGKKFRP